MKVLRLISLALIVAMLLCLFTACEQDDDDDDRKSHSKDKATVSDKIPSTNKQEAPEVYRGKMDSICVTDNLIAGVTADGGAYIIGGTSESGFSSVENWEDIVKVSVGSVHILGLKSDGTVVAAGNGSKGQCEVSGWTDIVDIHAGREFSFGLKSDGTVVVTRLTDSNFGKWENVIDIEGRGDFLYGLTADGSVYIGNKASCVGSNIESVHANIYYAIFVKNDGTVELSDQEYSHKCQGIEEWTDIVDVSTYYSNHFAALKSDGTVVAAGQNKNGQCDVSGWTDIVAIATGTDHTVGLRSDGTVVATGSNGYGQCDVSAWTDIVAIFAGNIVTVGLKSDGTVVAAGTIWEGLSDIYDWENIKTN